MNDDVYHASIENVMLQQTETQQTQSLNETN